jgi:hypothetical protein
MMLMPHPSYFHRARLVAALRVSVLSAAATSKLHSIGFHLRMPSGPLIPGDPHVNTSHRGGSAFGRSHVQESSPIVLPLAKVVVHLDGWTLVAHHVVETRKRFIAGPDPIDTGLDYVQLFVVEHFVQVSYLSGVNWRPSAFGTFGGAASRG